MPQDVLLQLKIQNAVSNKWTTSKLIESLTTYVTACKRSEKVTKPVMDSQKVKVLTNRQNLTVTPFIPK